MSAPHEFEFSFEEKDSNKMLKSLISMKKLSKDGVWFFEEIYNRIKNQEPELLVTFLNDLHWRDTSSLPLLDYKIEMLARQVYFESQLCGQMDDNHVRGWGSNFKISIDNDVALERVPSEMDKFFAKARLENLIDGEIKSDYFDKEMEAPKTPISEQNEKQTALKV